MRIDLGVKVRTKDGHDAGHIKQAILDPHRNEITEYVVSTGGLLSHDAILSSEMLESATRDGGAIVLDITKHDLEELARFEPTAYTTPPTEWLAPSAYSFPSGGYLFPVADATIVEEPPPRDELGRGPKIHKGMKVRDAAGTAVGEVAELRVDDQTGELRGIIAKRDGEPVEIDAQSIDHVRHDEVRLISEGAEIRGREGT